MTLNQLDKQLRILIIKGFFYFCLKIELTLKKFNQIV